MPEQLSHMMLILKTFSDFTGLKVNFSKSSLVPINITEERVVQLANMVGCKRECMPFTYLGLPMGSTRPKIDDLMPMVSRLDKRLSSISTMMSYPGRSVHLKAMVSALPIFAVCCIRLPLSTLDHFEKSGRGFLWHGNSINKHGKYLVNWKQVCLPKNAGGLGVLDLRIQNKALLTKYLYKFFNQMDIPWVQILCKTYYKNEEAPNYPTKVESFWWRDCCSMLNDFKEITICKITNGNTVKLWYDTWDESCLQNQFHQLFSYAKGKEITMASAYEQSIEDFYELFHLPIFHCYTTKHYTNADSKQSC